MNVTPFCDEYLEVVKESSGINEFYTQKSNWENAARKISWNCYSIDIRGVKI